MAGQNYNSQDRASIAASRGNNDARMRRHSVQYCSTSAKYSSSQGLLRIILLPVCRCCIALEV